MKAVARIDGRRQDSILPIAWKTWEGDVYSILVFEDVVVLENFGPLDAGEILPILCYNTQENLITASRHSIGEVDAPEISFSVELRPSSEGDEARIIREKLEQVASWLSETHANPMFSHTLDQGAAMLLREIKNLLAR